jgi:hypothetical protein
VTSGFSSAQDSFSESEAAARPLVESLALRRETVADESRPVVPPQRSTSQIVQSSLTPSQLSEPQGAIERLIERTVMPALLPGLELRMIDPEEHSSRADWEAKADSRQQRNENTQADGQTVAPVPSPPAPPLNINEVADKVYQTLMRRQQLERERKGLY